MVLKIDIHSLGARLVVTIVGKDLISFGYNLKQDVGILLFMIRIAEFIDTEDPDLGIIVDSRSGVISFMNP